MSKNYFSIERNGQCWSPIILVNENEEPIYEKFLDMNYEEMKTNTLLEDFVATFMDAADKLCAVEDDQTIVTLVGSDGVFIWSIIMGSENDDIRYCLVDWKKDGCQYRYED